MKGITRKNIYLYLLEKQLNLAEKTIMDALITKDWAKNWTITSIQEEKFKKHAISVIKGVLKISKVRAKIAYNMFRATHGLPIK